MLKKLNSGEMEILMGGQREPNECDATITHGINNALAAGVATISGVIAIIDPEPMTKVMAGATAAQAG